MPLGRLGWLPDPLKRPGETLDLDAEELLASRPSQQPPAEASLADLTGNDVLDQGNLGSCVANAGFQAIRIWHRGNGQPKAPLGSRLFGYWWARAYHGATTRDDGTYIRLFFQAIAKFGFCPEHVWDYTPHDKIRGVVKWQKQPPLVALERGLAQKAKTGTLSYRRIYADGAARVEAVMRAVATGHPVVFGTDLPADFGDRDTFDRPPPGARIQGGHAMVIDGYRRRGAEFDVLNSWGSSWGRRGRIWMTAEALTWTATRDLWIVEHPPVFEDR